MKVDDMVLIDHLRSLHDMLDKTEMRADDDIFNPEESCITPDESNVLLDIRHDLRRMQLTVGGLLERIHERSEQEGL